MGAGQGARHPQLTRGAGTAIILSTAAGAGTRNLALSPCLGKRHRQPAVVKRPLGDQKAQWYSRADLHVGRPLASQVLPAVAHTHSAPCKPTRQVSLLSQ